MFVYGMHGVHWFPCLEFRSAVAEVVGAAALSATGVADLAGLDPKAANKLLRDYKHGISPAEWDRAYLQQLSKIVKAEWRRNPPKTIKLGGIPDLWVH